MLVEQEDAPNATELANWYARLAKARAIVLLVKEAVEKPVRIVAETATALTAMALEK